MTTELPNSRDRSSSGASAALTRREEAQLSAALASPEFVAAMREEVTAKLEYVEHPEAVLVASDSFERGGWRLYARHNDGVTSCLHLRTAWLTQRGLAAAASTGTCDQQLPVDVDGCSLSNATNVWFGQADTRAGSVVVEDHLGGQHRIDGLASPSTGSAKCFALVLDEGHIPARATALDASGIEIGSRSFNYAAAWLSD